MTPLFCIKIFVCLFLVNFAQLPPNYALCDIILRHRIRQWTDKKSGLEPGTSRTTQVRCKNWTTSLLKLYILCVVRWLYIHLNLIVKMRIWNRRQVWKLNNQLKVSNCNERVFCFPIVIDTSFTNWNSKHNFIAILRDTPAPLACQPCLDLRPRSSTTIIY